MYKEYIQNIVGWWSVQGTYTEYSWLLQCTRNIYRIQLVAAVYKEHMLNLQSRSPVFNHTWYRLEAITFPVSIVSCRYFLWGHADTFYGVMQILFVVPCRYFYGVMQVLFVVPRRYFLWCHADIFCGVMQILFMVSCRYFYGIMQVLFVVPYRYFLWCHADTFYGVM